MTKLRKITLAVAILLTATAVGLGSHFKTLADKHREQVQQELRRMLGDSARFDGLDVRLFWLPGFVLHEFRVADDSRFAATPISKRANSSSVSACSTLHRPHRHRFARIHRTRNSNHQRRNRSAQSQCARQPRKELGTIPRRRSDASGERRQSSVRFAIDKIRVEDGRIIYLDRTVKEPAELQLRDVDLS